MNAIHVSQQKEVIVMDADGSLSGDDSVPLIFSEPRLVQDNWTHIHINDHSLVLCKAGN
jgi:hypothetical protein